MTPGIVIRPMDKLEAEDVATLIRAVVTGIPYYNERAKAEELAKYTAAKLIMETEADPDSVIVAVDGESPLGFCISRYDDGLIWLSWFGVRRESRHKGVGADLLEGLARTLMRRKAHKIWCDTRTENVAGVRALETFGFRKLSEIRNHWYGQDYYLWEWSPR